MADAQKAKQVITGRIELPRRGTPAQGDRILLATPAYGSTFSAEYVRSLFMLLSARPKRQLHYMFAYYDYADIVMSRNYLISDFYYNYPDYSHILFVDDDMGFDSGLVSDMVELEQPVVGTIAPQRQVNLRKLHANKDMPFEKALAHSLNFVGDLIKPVEHKGDFVRVRQCGTGILLIKREAIDRMIAKMPDIVDTTRFKKMPFAKKFTKFLTPFQKIKTDDSELSEDFSFCHRWINGCGGQIWAHTTRSIRHVGTIVVNSKYADLT